MEESVNEVLGGECVLEFLLATAIYEVTRLLSSSSSLIVSPSKGWVSAHRDDGISASPCCLLRCIRTHLHPANEKRFVVDVFNVTYFQLI